MRTALYGTLLALATLFLSPPVRAQVTGAVADRRQVNIHYDNADVRQALQQLFQSAGVNYAIDPMVRGTVTATATNVSFRTALETLLRSAGGGTPYTYRIENGVYHVGPMASAAEAPVEALRPEARTVKIPVNYLSADAVVRELKAMPRYGAGAQVAFQAHEPDNSIIATSTEADRLRDLRADVALLDVKPQAIAIRTEVVVTITDSRGRTHRAVLSSQGRTMSGQPLTLTSVTSDGGARIGSLAVQSGRFTLHITLRVNADGGIALEAKTDADFILREGTAGRPLHLGRSFDGSIVARDGQQALLSSSVLKLDGSAGATQAELLIHVTPRILVEEPHSSYGSARVLVTAVGNPFGETGDATSRAALEALGTELERSGLYDLVGAEEVERAAKALGLSEPYDDVALQRIAGATGAGAVVRGRITKLSRGAQGLSVGLAVSVLDAQHWMAVADAAAAGQAPAGLARTAAVRQAAGNAAFLAVRKLARTPAAKVAAAGTMRP